MWLNRTKSKIRNRTFSCSSFKDIQSLCVDESDRESPIESKKSSIFHRVRRASAVIRAFSVQPPERLAESESKSKPGPEPPQPDDAALSASPSPENGAAYESEPLISLPGAEKRIVIYFTSLRVVRSTFEDCKAVRAILRSFRVSIDERDLSMDSAFMEELQRILGVTEKTKLALPRVFIGGRYIGGAEEVRQLHEGGELKKYVEGLQPAEPGTCEVCGGYRFILCDECSGSHKCYSEKGGFRSCTSCNENGLIRCPSCSCAPL